MRVRIRSARPVRPGVVDLSDWGPPPADRLALVELGRDRVCEMERQLAELSSAGHGAPSQSTIQLALGRATGGACGGHGDGLEDVGCSGASSDGVGGANDDDTPDWIVAAEAQLALPPCAPPLMARDETIDETARGAVESTAAGGLGAALLSALPTELPPTRGGGRGCRLGLPRSPEPRVGRGATGAAGAAGGATAALGAAAGAEGSGGVVADRVHRSQSIGAAGPAVEARRSEEEGDACVVCLVAPRTYLLAPCGHVRPPRFDPPRHPGLHVPLISHSATARLVRCTHP